MRVTPFSLVTVIDIYCRLAVQTVQELTKRLWSWVMLFGSSRDPTAIAQVDLCQAWTSFQDLSVELKSLISHISICSPGGDGGGGGGVPLGSRKSYPLLDQILWPYTRLKMLNCSWFQSFVSNPVKRDLILDQFSMITRPYTRPNGLKTIPFPAAHTRIANKWEYPLPLCSTRSWVHTYTSARARTHTYTHTNKQGQIHIRTQDQAQTLALFTYLTPLDVTVVPLKSRFFRRGALYSANSVTAPSPMFKLNASSNRTRVCIHYHRNTVCISWSIN